jgi:hypothetical protein
MEDLGYKTDEELKQTIYDLLRTIKDPEKPNTLEVRSLKKFSLNIKFIQIIQISKNQDLNVVSEDSIFIQKPTDGQVPVVRIEFNPTGSCVLYFSV